MDDRNCVSCGTAARYCFDRGRALSEGCCDGCEHPPAGGDRANDTLRAEVQAALLDGLGWEWEPSATENIPSPAECISDAVDAVMALFRAALAAAVPAPDEDSRERCADGCNHLDHPVPEKKCPKARRTTGKKGHKPEPHEPHVWIAGVYYPVGDVDGYEACCPGVPAPAAPGSDTERGQG